MTKRRKRHTPEQLVRKLRDGDAMPTDELEQLVVEYREELIRQGHPAAELDAIIDQARREFEPTLSELSESTRETGVRENNQCSFRMVPVPSKRRFDIAHLDSNDVRLTSFRRGSGT